MNGQTATRTLVAVWVLVGAGIGLTTDSTPAWTRISLAAVFGAPVAVALILWPVLLVRGLPEVTAPDVPASDEPETRIQVLDGGDSR
jgi:hypothetical protein